MFLFSIGEDRFAAYLRVTRWPSDRDEIVWMPVVLHSVCMWHRAKPLLLRVNLPGNHSGRSSFHGLEPLEEAIQESLKKWNHLMLGEVDLEAWSGKGGAISKLSICGGEGWPYALVDGRPVLRSEIGDDRRGNLPVHPGELCRSVVMGDICWLFTCECGVPECGGVQCGVCVSHQGAHTIWRNPRCSDRPLAVFSRSDYRRTVLLAVKAILQPKGRRHGLNWTMVISPSELRVHLARVYAGVTW